MITIQLTATTESKEILQKFMQHIQDFNASHNDGIHFEMFVDPQGLTLEEAEQMLDSLVPQLPYKTITKFGKA